MYKKLYIFKKFEIFYQNIKNFKIEPEDLISETAFVFYCMYSIQFAVWLVYINYNFNKPKTYKSLTKTALENYHYTTKILIFSFICFKFCYWCDYEYYNSFKYYYFFIHFIVYKKVRYSYLSNKKYKKCVFEKDDKFLKDLKSDLDFNKDLSFKEFLKLSKNDKKMFLCKYTFLHAHKYFWFEIINIFCNIITLNFVLFRWNKFSIEKSMIFYKIDMSETKPRSFFSMLIDLDCDDYTSVHIPAKELTDFFYINKNISLFFVCFCIIILILTSITGMFYKIYVRNSKYNYYLYKYSFFNVLINAVLIYNWYNCLKTSDFSFYLHSSFIYEQNFVVFIAPHLHLVTIVWCTFYLKRFNIMVGTLINVYFDFDLEKIKNYTWIYYYMNNFYSYFLFLYFSYITFSNIYLYYYPHIFVC